MAGTPQQPGNGNNAHQGNQGYPGPQGPQGHQGPQGPQGYGPGGQGPGMPPPPAGPPPGSASWPAAPPPPVPPPAGPPSGPPSGQGGWGPAGPGSGPPAGASGGFQDSGAWSAGPSPDPYPQASPYGHYQMYGHNTGPMPAPPGAPTPAGNGGGRSRKTMITWVSVIAGGVIAAVVGTLLVGDPVEENRRENAEIAAGPSVSAPPSSMPDPSATATRPGGVSVSGEIVIPSAPPKVVGPKFNASSDAGTWPDACEVLTDEEILAAIPESKVIRRTGEKDTLMGKTPKDNECRIEVTFPGLTRPDDYPARISVQVWGVDKLSFDPKSGSVNAQQAQERFTRSKQSKQRVAQSFPGTFDDLGTKLGADDSYRDGNNIDMIKGAFKITLVFNAQMVDTNRNPLPSATFCKQHGAAVAMVVAAKM